jgi:hypothetical protein
MTEYGKSFSDHLKQIANLVEHRDKLDGQIDKLKKLASANYELMDDKEKAAYSGAFEELNRSDQSLTHEVRRALMLGGGEYLTPTQIRDRLVKSGYDFSRYQSNPLVSIHSTLNRMKGEVDTVILEEGTKGYRFHHPPARKRTSR